MYDAVLVRYGEIGLKGKNRPLFEERLVGNIRAALRGLAPAQVERVYGRILVQPTGDREEVLARLARVFGVVSVSPAVEVALEMDAISAAALQVLRDAGVHEGTTFKVDARRADKRFGRTSMEINQQVGADILQELPFLQVRMDDPDRVVAVEVREDAAYVFSHSLAGPGGLPVGVSSRGLLLLSGGIDSPVAGWMAMKRGIAVEGLHFHSYPFTDERSKQKVIDLCRVLARWGGPVRLSVVHFTEAQTAIRRHCPAELGVTIMRRVMIRVADVLARRERIPALITGESVGQVASQTLESISVIEAVTDLPILRPLVCLDKTEIIERARRIGTYPISILPFEDCCALFVPKHPETRPRPGRVQAAEAALDIDALVADAVENTEVLELEAEVVV